MAGDDIVIRIRGLRSAFGEQVVHEDLDLDVYRGEIIGVVGGSGTGKSVLLKAIVGLGKPTAGHIEVFGQSVLDATEKQLKTLERRWGVLFQDGALFSSLTVAENIAVPIKEYLKVPHDLMCEIIALKLSLVGLPPDTGVKYPSQLSGGMRKRASLARALALDPELLFLDEPTSGLDPIGANAFDELIKNLQQTLGLTVFMVTHDLDFAGLGLRSHRRPGRPARSRGRHHGGHAAPDPSLDSRLFPRPARPRGRHSK